MARPLRLELPGGIYHVTARGNERRWIFRDDADRLAFLDVLARVLDRFGWLCLAYCLMGNHYHLLVETPRPNLARGMRQLNGVYAQRFNRRHNRVGHLTQGRYGAVLVEGDEHLLTVASYIVRNPVRAKLCAHAEEWRWSSYRATLGLAPPGTVAVDAILLLLGPTRPAARLRFRSFVEQGGARPQPSGGGVVFGGEPFVRAHTSDVGPVPEVPRRHRRPLRPPLAELLGTLPPDEAIACAYREYDYRMREIAGALGCHYTTISRRLRAFEKDGMS